MPEVVRLNVTTSTSAGHDHGLETSERTISKDSRGCYKVAKPTQPCRWRRSKSRTGVGVGVDADAGAQETMNVQLVNELRRMVAVCDLRG